MCGCVCSTKDDGERVNKHKKQRAELGEQMGF